MGGGARQPALRAGGPGSAGGGGCRRHRGGRRLACRGDRLEDPVPQPGHPGVDPRPPGFRTANAPADDAGQEEPARGLLADQGASRVTLGDRGTPSGGVRAPGLSPKSQSCRDREGTLDGPAPRRLPRKRAETSHPRTSVSPLHGRADLGTFKSSQAYPGQLNTQPRSAPPPPGPGGSQWVTLPWWG